MGEELVEGEFYWFWDDRADSPHVAHWSDGEWWFTGTELGGSFVQREPVRVQHIPRPE
jgi:hypothetical protein